MSRGNKVIGGMLKYTLILAILFFVGRFLWVDRVQFVDYFGHVGFIFYSSVFTFSLFLFVQAWIWSRLLNTPFRQLGMFRGTTISQFAKYLPGAIWNLVGRMVLAGKYGATFSAQVKSIYYENLLLSYKVIRRRFLQQEKIQISSWPRLIYHTLATIRTEKTDVTIYGYILIGLIGLLLQLLFHRKYVISVHGKDLLEFRRFWGLHWLCKTILRRADGVLANSRFSKQIVMDYGVDERKIQVVYPGVEAEFDRGEKSEELLEKHDLIGKYVLLTVGRLVKRKGHDKVIEALPAIVAKVPEAMYVIVGNGPERDNLEQLAVRYGVRDHVTFVGSVTGTELLQQYYRICLS